MFIRHLEDRTRLFRVLQALSPGRYVEVGMGYNYDSAVRLMLTLHRRNPTRRYFIMGPGTP